MTIDEAIGYLDNWCGTLPSNYDAAVSVVVAELRRLRSPTPRDGFVRVRAAVAVNAEGEWYVYGNSDYEVPGDDAEVLEEAQSNVVEQNTGYWIEADIELPTPKTVAARSVEGAK